MKLGSTKALNRQLMAIVKPIMRHHAILFTVFALVSMIIAIYTTNTILTQPSDEEYRSSASEKAVQTNFNQKTIDKINQLRDRDDQTNPELPSGRLNPFTN